MGAKSAPEGGGAIQWPESHCSLGCLAPAAWRALADYSHGVLTSKGRKRGSGHPALGWRMNVYRRIVGAAPMSRISSFLAMFALIAVIGSSAPALAQCSNQIALVPLTEQKAADKARDFVRFRYTLSSSDKLLVQSHEDNETSTGPYDTGLSITRGGKEVQGVSLRDLPELRNREAFESENFTTLAVARACGSAGAVYFLAMQWMGDETSPALLFVIFPSARGYVISHLPMISGGVLEISRANPLHLRTWDNLGEGECNGCKTAYGIREFEIRDGRPVQTRKYRTQHLHASVDAIFDDRRRMRFVP